MGTRSLTRVYDDGECVLTMYRQMDGYPTGHGQELKDFAVPMVIVNGISLVETHTIANGMGCFAAQLVAHFKHGVGGIYLYPTDTIDAGQEYEYRVSVGKDSQIHLKVFTYKGRLLYDGLIQDFDPQACEEADA